MTGRARQLPRQPNRAPLCCWKRRWKRPAHPATREGGVRCPAWAPCPTLMPTSEASNSYAIEGRRRHQAAAKIVKVMELALIDPVCRCSQGRRPQAGAFMPTDNGRRRSGRHRSR